MRHDSVVSRYAIPTGIPQVDGWSMGPSGFGASQLCIREKIYEYLRLDGCGSKSLDLLSFGVTVCTSERRYVIT